MPEKGLKRHFSARKPSFHFIKRVKPHEKAASRCHAAAGAVVSVKGVTRVGINDKFRRGFAGFQAIRQSFHRYLRHHGYGGRSVADPKSGFQSGAAGGTVLATLYRQHSVDVVGLASGEHGSAFALG